MLDSPDMRASLRNFSGTPRRVLRSGSLALLLLRR
jgi:hypothetical protein